MIGVLIITHENLGESLIRCATHVMGEEQHRLKNIPVFIQDDPDTIISKAQAIIRQLNDGSGVLVLTDIIGATPYNIACQLIVPGKVVCLAGANLPMLIRLLSCRTLPLSQSIEKALSGGRDGIIPIYSNSQHAE